MRYMSVLLACAMALSLSAQAFAGKPDPIVAKYTKQGYSVQFAQCMYRGVSGQNDKGRAFSESETFSWCQNNGYNK